MDYLTFIKIRKEYNDGLNENYIAYINHLGKDTINYYINNDYIDKQNIRKNSRKIDKYKEYACFLLKHNPNISNVLIHEYISKYEQISYSYICLLIREIKKGI